MVVSDTNINIYGHTDNKGTDSKSKISEKEQTLLKIIWFQKGFQLLE